MWRRAQLTLTCLVRYQSKLASKFAMLQSPPGQTTSLASVSKSVRLAAMQTTSLNGVSQCAQSQNSRTETHPLIDASRGAPPSQLTMPTTEPEPVSLCVLAIPMVRQSLGFAKLRRIALVIISQITSPNVASLSAQLLRQLMLRILLSVASAVAQ